MSSFFSLFPFLKKDLVTAILSLRPFMLHLVQLLLAEGPDTALCQPCVSLLDFVFSSFLHITFRYCSSVVASCFQTWHFYCSPLIRFSLLFFFQDTLCPHSPCMLQYSVSVFALSSDQLFGGRAFSCQACFILMTLYHPIRALHSHTAGYLFLLEQWFSNFSQWVPPQKGS